MMVRARRWSEGYNVRTAFDAKHQLITAHEMTDVGSDRDQHGQAGPRSEVQEGFSVVADRGYLKSEEVLDCNDAGIPACVPLIF
ncbi:hypothetical protein DXV65_20295 [Pseudomonas fluorescens]|nr:hypothetical protein DXV65_20295 [Pseudomonas fluorescens]